MPLHNKLKQKGTEYSVPFCFNFTANALMTVKKPIFTSSVTYLVLAIVLSALFALRQYDNKTDLRKATGIVTAISNINDHFPGKDTARYRYLQLSAYDKPFQLFIGKSTGDFSPQLDKIAALSPGDSVTVYFRESDQTISSPVNNLAHFIDRGATPIFIKGNAGKWLVWGMAVFCVLMIAVLVWLKARGRII